MSACGSREVVALVAFVEHGFYLATSANITRKDTGVLLP